jgi:hypothetical protein
MHKLARNGNETAKAAPDRRCGPETIKLNEINGENSIGAAKSSRNQAAK